MDSNNFVAAQDHTGRVDEPSRLDHLRSKFSISLHIPWDRVYVVSCQFCQLNKVPNHGAWKRPNTGKAGIAMTDKLRCRHLPLWSMARSIRCEMQLSSVYIQLFTARRVISRPSSNLSIHILRLAIRRCRAQRIAWKRRMQKEGLPNHTTATLSTSVRNLQSINIAYVYLSSICLKYVAYYPLAFTLWWRQSRHIYVVYRERVTLYGRGKHWKDAQSREITLYTNMLNKFICSPIQGTIFYVGFVPNRYCAKLAAKIALCRG